MKKFYVSAAVIMAISLFLNLPACNAKGISKTKIKSTFNKIKNAVTHKKHENKSQESNTMKITFNQLPNTLEEFKALPQLDLTAPENTCAMFICALNLYTKNKEDGFAAINILRGPRPLNGLDKQRIRDRLMDKTYLAAAYFEGAVPTNNYTPSVPYVINVLPDPSQGGAEEGYTNRYLKTSGADSPRPIKLRKKGENWYLWEYSSIYLDIRKPAAEDPWL